MLAVETAALLSSRQTHAPGYQCAVGKILTGRRFSQFDPNQSFGFQLPVKFKLTDHQTVRTLC